MRGVGRDRYGRLPAMPDMLAGRLPINVAPGPDVVIVMNPVYADEIRGDLNSRRLAPELLLA